MEGWKGIGDKVSEDSAWADIHDKGAKTSFAPSAETRTSVMALKSGNTSTVSFVWFSLGAVSIGAITAGLGLVYGAWLLVLYSGGNSSVPRTSHSPAPPFPLPCPFVTTLTSFQQITKAVYNTYLFFSLAGRLPILCMTLSTLSLMSFLLAVPWSAWPTAVLVMFFVAGFLLMSQFIIFLGLTKRPKEGVKR